MATRTRDNGTTTDPTPAPTVTLPVEVARFLRGNLASQSLPAGHPQFAEWAGTVRYVLAELDAQLAKHDG